MPESSNFSMYEFQHPTQDILMSLDNEIRAWCKNHDVKIVRDGFGIRRTNG